MNAFWLINQSLKQSCFVCGWCSSVHTSPWHRVRQKLHIWKTRAPIPHKYAHQIFSDSEFLKAAIWYFSLICFPAQIDSHHKRNIATVTYFLKFMSIFQKIHTLLTSEASCALTYTWPSKAKLCTFS